MSKFLTVTAGAFALLLATGAMKAGAQLISETTPTPTANGTMPGDVQPSDWAYQAIQDCASHGLIAGYPPDGNFLGNHAITRFEAATIVARILAKIDEMKTPGNGTVSQAQLDEVSKLADDLKVELTVIGTNMTQAQADIKTLQTNVADLQAGLGSAYDALEEQKASIAKVKTEADAAYSSNPKAKFVVSGYIQARMVAAEGGKESQFPNGTPAAGGAANGFYAMGAARDGFQVRRARLRFSGQLTPNTGYAAQFDLQGAVSTTNQQLTTREAWVGYTFGDGSSKYPTLTAGLFATPYGNILPGSTATMITPERPLAFSESSLVGSPFVNDDYDKGAMLSYGVDGFNFKAAVINGTGRNTENIYSTFDSIIGATYTASGLPFAATVGACYYGGVAFRAQPSGTTTPDYPEPKRDLFDVNAQLGYNNFFLNGELEKGTFEEVSYFANSAATSLTSNTYVKGNTIFGDYLMGGYTFNPKGSHPFTLAGDYDEFQRSVSAKVVGFGKPQYDDVNIGYGALYNLDKSTRLRLWYDEPTRVAHQPGVSGPSGTLGLFTSEIQVRF